MPVLDTLKREKMDNVLTTQVAAKTRADAVSIGDKLTNAGISAKVVFTQNPDPLCFVYTDKLADTPVFESMGIKRI